MSIVVAVKKGRRIIMAADQLISCGTHREPPDNAATSKIRRVGSALLGSTGWSLYDNIFDDFLGGKRPPRLSDKQSIFKFFLKLWRAMHERYSLVNDQPHEKESPFGDLDASFIVANRRGIFVVYSNMSVCEFKKYYAIGGGADYAFGAMYNLYGAQRDPKKIAVQAVKTGIEFDVHCGGDVDVHEIKGR